MHVATTLDGVRAITDETLADGPAPGVSGAWPIAGDVPAAPGDRAGRDGL